MRFARMCNEKGTKKGAARRQLPVIHRFAVLKANSAILCDLEIEVKQFLAGRAPGRKLSVTVLDDIGCRDRLSETVVHKHRMLAAIIVRTGREACGREPVFLIAALLVVQTAERSGDFGRR